MNTLSFKCCQIAICFALVTTLAHAQEKVHALSGTVRSIEPKYKMMEIDPDNGSSPHFTWDRHADAKFDFNKTVSAEATPAEKFTTKGRHVIVYYYGDDLVRTVVALSDLGDAPLQANMGRVVNLNLRDHVLTIKDEAGKESTFHLEPKTVADTATGVSMGFKYELSKGDHVCVTSTKDGANDTALLVAPAS